jgi:hypothetical protein
MNYANLAKFGNALRIAGILLIVLFLLDRFTGFSFPVADKFKFSAIIIWLLGTILLRWTQFQRNKSNQE